VGKNFVLLIGYLFFSNILLLSDAIGKDHYNTGQAMVEPPTKDLIMTGGGGNILHKVYSQLPCLILNKQNRY
jgi:hypothetical protein